MNQLSFTCISEIIRVHDYILLRDTSNRLYGVNCKVAILGEKRTDFNNDGISLFQSYIPCDIQLYITYKSPYHDNS